MFDRTLAVSILDQIIDAAVTIENRCAKASRPESFTDTEEGQMLLDSVCMKLVAIGESLKQLDHATRHELLKNYPQVEWKKIKGMRDFISHHYFDLDAEVVYDICKNHIETLNKTLVAIRADLLES